jgi:hypothetical protein
VTSYPPSSNSLAMFKLMLIKGELQFCFRRLLPTNMLGPGLGAAYKPCQRANECMFRAVNTRVTLLNWSRSLSFEVPEHGRQYAIPQVWCNIMSIPSAPPLGHWTLIRRGLQEPVLTRSPIVCKLVDLYSRNRRICACRRTIYTRHN